MIGLTAKVVLHHAIKSQFKEHDHDQQALEQRAVGWTGIFSNRTPYICRSNTRKFRLDIWIPYHDLR